MTDIDVGKLDWEHTLDRTPYENLRALVGELPPDTPDEDIVELAFRHITGYCPDYAPRALGKIREEGVEE